MAFLAKFSLFFIMLAFLITVFSGSASASCGYSGCTPELTIEKVSAGTVTASGTYVERTDYTFNESESIVFKMSLRATDGDIAKNEFAIWLTPKEIAKFTGKTGIAKNAWKAFMTTPITLTGGTYTVKFHTQLFGKNIDERKKTITVNSNSIAPSCSLMDKNYAQSVGDSVSTYVFYNRFTSTPSTSSVAINCGVGSGASASNLTCNTEMPGVCSYTCGSYSKAGTYNITASIAGAGNCPGTKKVVVSTPVVAPSCSLMDKNYA